MKVTPLGGPFGVAVSDIDLASDCGEATMRELIGLLHTHQALVIRDQQLGKAEFLRFGRQWGDPVFFAKKSDTLNDFPEIIRISNETSTPERYRDGAIHWHSDNSYEDEPASVTMLYCLETPDTPDQGWTHLASTVQAYDALPDETKREIEGMTALHCLGGSPELPDEKIPVFPEAIARHGITRHRLVMPHPVTGRKALFPSGTAFGAEGMEIEEGRAFIAGLRAHIVQPQFVTRYKVMPGELLLWDNYQTLHTATPVVYSDEPGKRRLIHRISVRGQPELVTRQAKAA